MTTSANDDRRSDLAVMDSNEYKQKRRLERIFDAHDRVEEQIAEAQELFTLGEIGADGRDVMILQAVQQFIREIYNLLDPEDHAHYWTDQRLGTLEMVNHVITFDGLADILSAEPFYRDRYTDTVETPCGADVEQTFTESYAVPKDISLEAYLTAKEFIAEEHDLRLQFESLDDGVPMVDGFRVVPEGGDESNGTTGK